jgi:hypothetical protein
MFFSRFAIRNFNAQQIIAPEEHFRNFVRQGKDRETIASTARQIISPLSTCPTTWPACYISCLIEGKRRKKR